MEKIESFNDIHETERRLSNGDVVISANEKIICLASIIGDKKTSITKLTRKILIESSFFDGNSKRRHHQMQRTICGL